MVDAKKHGNHSANEQFAASLPLRKREDAQEGISNTSYSAIADLGYKLSANNAVFPIVLKSEDGKKLSVVGTGFFVGPDIIL